MRSNDFSERVIHAREQLPAGPPLITMPRDIETTVARRRIGEQSEGRKARQKADERLARGRRRRGAGEKPPRL